MPGRHAGPNVQKGDSLSSTPAPRAGGSRCGAGPVRRPIRGAEGGAFGVLRHPGFFWVAGGIWPGSSLDGAERNPGLGWSDDSFVPVPVNRH